MKQYLILLRIKILISQVEINTLYFTIMRPLRGDLVYFNCGITEITINMS
jgi:hypothetical protein